MKIPELSPDQVDSLFSLAERITGTCQKGIFRKDILLDNVLRRVSQSSSDSLESYLQLVLQSPEEFEHFVSALTIHTTSWFREEPHFSFLEKQVESFKHARARTDSGASSEVFRFWSAACSTGEEAYSAALKLHHAFGGKDSRYEVMGTDIDPISVRFAARAIFPESPVREQVDSFFLPNFLFGRGRLKGQCTIAKEIRDRCHFSSVDLSDPKSYPAGQSFDVIFLRNVLIYFSQDAQTKIVEEVSKRLKVGGALVLGHCDRHVKCKGLRSAGNAVYVRIEGNGEIVMPTKLGTVRNHQRKKVLIVDDSATLRRTLRKVFGYLFDVEEASSASVAEAAISTSHYDLITLDLNMPGENGVSFLRRLRDKKVEAPVVIVSDSSPDEAERVFGALEGGAQEYVRKSELFADADRIVEIAKTLTQRKSSHSQRSGFLHRFPDLGKKGPFDAILVGASTGGPEALCRLLANLPSPFPPVVVVQHISPEFANAFGCRLAKAANAEYWGGKEKTELKPNTIYLGDGDFHYTFSRAPSGIFLSGNQQVKRNGHRPSVDVLFESAEKADLRCVAVLLTGMGSDGAQGMKKLFKSGRAITFAQDENSSVVFGMPKCAIQDGAVHFVGDISQIRQQIEKIVFTKGARYVA